MNRAYQADRSRQRDAGLRRMRRINRTLAAAMVALTLLFANAAARAFPGHARAAKSTPPPAPSSRRLPAHGSATRPVRHRPGGHRARSRHAESPRSATTQHSATSRTTVAPANTATSPALSPPASPPQAAAPSPAPAPVVSGGS